jgi:pimeloyl-ACP methyl ester carboxylesterase
MKLAATSKDGTRIAYDKAGHGPVVVVLLPGALNSRKSGASLAKLLASRFTVVGYDRRGRLDVPSVQQIVRRSVTVHLRRSALIQAQWAGSWSSKTSALTE